MADSSDPQAHFSFSFILKRIKSTPIKRENWIYYLPLVRNSGENILLNIEIIVVVVGQWWGFPISESQRNLCKIKKKSHQLNRHFSNAIPWTTAVAIIGTVSELELLGNGNDTFAPTICTSLLRAKIAGPTNCPRTWYEGTTIWFKSVRCW